MNRIQGTINWLSVTSEISHFFCCGIPIVFSLISLLANAGILAAMPVGLEAVHDVMHHYEIPLIIMSAVIITSGWVLHYVAKRIDCRNTGCAHPPCDKKKNKSSRILFIATILFVVNLMSYFVLHT